MDQETLNKILEDYKKELQDLYDRREKRAKERENMTEDELIESIVKDLEEVEKEIKNKDDND